MLFNKDVAFKDWNAEKIISIASITSIQRMEGVCKKMISKMRAKFNEQKSGVIYKFKEVEHHASAPGESPAKLTGKLAKALQYRVTREGDSIIGRIGVNLDKDDGNGYALYLEVGTAKMKGNRPYLRSTLFENQNLIAKMLAE